MNNQTKRLILIIEDEPDIVDLLQMSLTMTNFDVVKAYNGPEGLAILETRKPDLILLDIMMPGMSGYEVCKKIRINKSWDSIPIIFLTARGKKADAEQGLELGANDYIVKPFEPHELVDQVRSFLKPKGSPFDSLRSLRAGDASRKR